MSSAGLAPLASRTALRYLADLGIDRGAPANQVQCQDVLGYIRNLQPPYLTRYRSHTAAELRVALDAMALEVTRHATPSHELHVEASEME